MDGIGSLAPLGRRSVVDAIVDQLRVRILRGEWKPGDRLPAEKDIAEALGVSRPAVREALNRLAAARLVSIPHSAVKQVLDYRRCAGLELLPALLVSENGEIDVEVVRGVVEMRSALAPDIARLAATRRPRATVEQLRAIVARMEAAGGDLAALQDLAEEFWSALVDGAGNVAYRLAYNSLRVTYDASKRLLTEVLAPELRGTSAYAGITDAVARRQPARAEGLARVLIGRGERSLKGFLARIASR